MWATQNNQGIARDVDLVDRKVNHYRKQPVFLVILPPDADSSIVQCRRLVASPVACLVKPTAWKRPSIRPEVFSKDSASVILMIESCLDQGVRQWFQRLCGGFPKYFTFNKAHDAIYKTSLRMIPLVS